ncbi:MAG: leucyl aminopeptidase [Cereibacter sphaeroides]|uniref:Probable cytosol aminopeptidase n=1 Tax=Cereibacter sphaeroides TaxID=1063 RepID=A0A2W5TMT2_CERSP|nr:MAG: leucyl aminopeptidase [Cereibacter sphaeroides]
MTLTLRLQASTDATANSPVLVVLRAGRSALGPQASGIDAQSGGAIVRACATPRFSGAVGECIDLLAPSGISARKVVVLGLGDPAAISALAAVRAGAALAQHLETEQETEATILFDVPSGSALASDVILARLLLGMRLRNYRFQLMPKAEKPFDLRVTLVTGHKPAELQRGEAIAEGVALARTLVNFPASHLNPDNFADHLAPLVDAGVAVEVLETADLERLGMNAVLAVGNGSDRKPRVIVLSYRGEGSSAQPLALIGKGMCFDAGGLCIKTGPQMFAMKGDMGGAAAVIGTMLALARQKAPVHVVGLLGVAENMLSGNSYKPGDIVTTMSGRTVEVFDTDCEGRMVLADVLHYAATRFQPRAMVDLATLTYSVMRGLGHVFAGLFATHDALAKGLLEAGETVGERFWRLPLDPAYDENLRSPIADLRQHGRDLEDGDAPVAAAFLRNFAEAIPWVHLDIAGKEMIDEDRALSRSGGTGFGVQLLEEWIHACGPDLKNLAV